ncbi:hypothetical protein EIO_1589 [Ketogulonicigenium vulgare Y25]|nr:hypothetical protein EIO_1589 [Ketogulonicigenium vulgare Y25]AOZ54625.1 hypothetical protein KVC_1611 [Ketogulonicigenium vulgare]
MHEWRLYHPRAARIGKWKEPCFRAARFSGWSSIFAPKTREFSTAM